MTPTERETLEAILLTCDGKGVGAKRAALDALVCRSGDLIPSPAKRDWVNCPICGESDMRREEDVDGNALILCVNHACASNGGTNADALRPLPSFKGRGVSGRIVI